MRRPCPGAPHETARLPEGLVPRSAQRAGCFVIEALLGFGAVFVLALLRIPLAFAMGAVGVAGLGLMRGWGPTAASAAHSLRCSRYWRRAARCG